MMRATIGAVLALGLIYTLQQFDLFPAITEGGPANSSSVAQYWAWQMVLPFCSISPRARRFR